MSYQPWAQVQRIACILFGGCETSSRRAAFGTAQALNIGAAMAPEVVSIVFVTFFSVFL